MATFISKANTPKVKVQGDAFKTKIKASDKGCVSIYGLGQRFPVSLYPKAMLALLNRADGIRAWIEANKDNLSWEGPEAKGPEDADTLG